jgi:apolipoprotein N-acyltransferase
MSVVFALWHLFKAKEIFARWSPVFFIVLWCSWEYLHLHWQLSWPWLNLGNIFAPATQIVQWYEFTGTFGGTIWLLAANFLLYNALRKVIREKKATLSPFLYFILWIGIPVCGSLFYYFNYSCSKSYPVNAVVVQPNTDPWEEQYRMSNGAHARRLLGTASSYLTPRTELMVCPESALPHNVGTLPLLRAEYKDTNLYENNPYKGFAVLDSFVSLYPQLNIVGGMSDGRLFDHAASRASRQVDSGLYVEYYNSSFCLNTKGISGIYHKSRLVPGVEIMPYPSIFFFLKKLAEKFGGITGTLGVDTIQRTFLTTIHDRKLRIGVPICYESIYGELFGQFTLRGAGLMCIITNDAWWKETPGHKQHFIYAKLRAVESRRTILRAANTGISAIIDERGNVVQRTRYNEPSVLKATVFPNQKITFYARYGDYLARMSLAVCGLLLASGCVKILTSRKKSKL